MVGNKIRKGKIWCKTNVKKNFGSCYSHRPLKSNWIQMVTDHDEPLEVYVSRKNELETKMFKEALKNGRLNNYGDIVKQSDVGQSDNSKAIQMIDDMLNGV